MAKSKVCCFDSGHDRTSLAELNCGDQSHKHLSRAQALELVQQGAVEWVLEPLSRHEKGIVRELKQNFSIRGLSCRVGASLAEAVYGRQAWALVMMSDIRGHG